MEQRTLNFLNFCPKKIIIFNINYIIHAYAISKITLSSIFILDVYNNSELQINNF